MAWDATVDEADFFATLQKLRDLRAWAVKMEIDPWSFRQALITVIRLDTEAAFERGVDPHRLMRFDQLAKLSASDFVKGLK